MEKSFPKTFSRINMIPSSPLPEDLQRLPQCEGDDDDDYVKC